MPFDMRRRVRPTPVALFREAVGSPAGLTLDPSARGTLFQDAEGTTPAYLPGHPVGLMLDGSQGVTASDVFGDNVLTNGGFDTDSDWTKQTGWTIGSGVASCDGTQASITDISQAVLTVGDVYLCRVTVTALSAGQFRVVAGGSAASDWQTAPGTYEFLLTAAGTSLSLRGDADFVGSVDNVTVRKLTRTTQGLGSEEVTNGDFSNGTTGWSAGNSAVLSEAGGQLTIEIGAGQTYGFATQTLTTVTGAYYLVEADLSTTDGSSIQLPGGTVVLPYTTGRDGSYSCIAVATGTSSVFNVIVNGVAGDTMVVDNISVRKLPGNHAIQDTNDDYRPILARHPDGGVRNLLNSSNNPTSSDWGIWGNGTTITWQASGEYHKMASTTNVTDGEKQTITVDASRKVIFSVKLTYGDSDETGLIIYDTNATNTAASITLTWSAGVPSITATTGSPVDHEVIDLGNGEYRAVVGVVTAATVTSHQFVIQPGKQSVGSYTYAKDFDVEYDTLSDYQDRVDQYDVTEEGKRDCWCLAFDGVDDSLRIDGLDLSGTDAVSVFAGVRKEDDDTVGFVAEYSANAGSNDGSFQLAFPKNNATDDVAFLAKGTVVQSTTVSGYAAPLTSVLSALTDISDDTLSLRLDGSEIGSSAGNLGTGNFGSHALYIGMRAGSSLPFTGNIYSLTVLGRLANDAEIAGAEQHAARRAGIVI